MSTMRRSSIHASVRLLTTGLGVVVGIAAGLLVGVLVGLTNGVAVTWLRIPAFIVTLATLLDRFDPAALPRGPWVVLGSRRR